MSGPRLAVGVVGCAMLLAVLAFVVFASPSEVVSASGKGGPGQPTSASELEHERRPPSARTAAASEVPASVELSVEVRDPAGEAVPSMAVVRSHPSAAILHQLCPSPPGRIAGAEMFEHDGSFSRSISAREHVVVRIRTRTEVLDRWLQPSDGDRKVTVVVGRESERYLLRAQLLDADVASPVAGAEIRCSRPSADKGKEGPATARTDAHGIAVFEFETPEPVLVSAPHTRPEDGPPHVQRVVVGANGLQSAAVTLVLPEERHATRFEILSDVAKSPGGAGMLVLERTSGGASRGAVLVERLVPGKTSIELALPRGVWRPFVIPRDRLGVVSDRGAIALPDEGTVRLRVRSNRQVCRLTLVGGAFGVEPFEVSVRDADAARVERSPGLHTIGPGLWAGPRAEVGSMPEPVILCALARSSTWVSGRVELRPGAVRVPMKVACRLRVRWFGWKPQAHGEPTLSIVVDGVEQLARMQPDLSPATGFTRPALTTEVVVPCGRAVLECQGGDRSTIWRRKVDLDTYTRLVVVGFDR